MLYINDSDNIGLFSKHFVEGRLLSSRESLFNNVNNKMCMSSGFCSSHNSDCIGHVTNLLFCVPKLLY